eukprot:7387373-Prymnesium_polylepis.1
MLASSILSLCFGGGDEDFVIQVCSASCDVPEALILAAFDELLRSTGELVRLDGKLYARAARAAHPLPPPVPPAPLAAQLPAPAGTAPSAHAAAPPVVFGAEMVQLALAAALRAGPAASGSGAQQ